MNQPTTLEITESGECPNCGEIQENWIPYITPEKGEVGIICSICNAHFVDKELSLEEFDM